MDAERDERVEAIARAATLPAPLSDDLVVRYYRNVGIDDLADRDPAELARALEAHLELGSTRLPGTDAIRLVRPTTIDIVTDDMPFLVDSVSGSLLRSGHNIELLIHPQLTVLRSPDGELLDIVDASDHIAGALNESWMHIELHPAPEESIEVLPDQLQSVLRDVRMAVDDWQPMRDRALALADELESHEPVGVSHSDVADAVELLRWLVDDNFTFVGYREYSLSPSEGGVLLAEEGSALGVMRHDPTESTSFSKLSPEARDIALQPNLLVLTKANRRSTVHRPVYLDYVGVKRFDDRGHVIGEHRFLGLYAATAYSQSVTEIPVVRRKVTAVIEGAGLPPTSHDGRDLAQFLETYPRDELFEIHVERLAEIAEQVLHLQERRQTRCFLRYDDFGRFVSALVYLPRDRYTTTVRERMQAVLREAFDAESVDFTARVTESVLARLHFLVRVSSGKQLTHVDEDELERRLADATKSWEDQFEEAIVDSGEPDGIDLLTRYAHAFPEAYKEDVSAAAALEDVRRLMALGESRPMSVRLCPPEAAEPGDGVSLEQRRFKVYRTGAAMSLSEMLPVLQEMGVGVVDERPYSIRARNAEQGWIYDFGITMPVPDEATADSLPTRFEDAFIASWEGRLDRDGFTALVVAAGLTWRQVALVQTLMAYVRQLGSTFSQRYSEQVLATHADVVRDIVALFESRLDPDRPLDDSASHDAVRDVTRRLDAIASLDEDRIVRSLLTVVLAVLRTNYFQTGPREVIAVKVDPRAIPEAPAPKPVFEIWVHSPRVSGVHLRFGRVARGGLRWSDRREDFRTEVLGLVKAQMVKNAVIVPVGAKGGFVCSRPVDPTDREAVLQEGIACYRIFVSAMLDITDNLVAGAVVPPERVARRDGDDPYLVVAADKGTATFSDIANAIAADHDFWLGDAFASGGSAGYDHKAMGITARGAWESVRRHFRELDVNVQAEDFTVVGVGDMSGDVFGNGMLLSEHIRLVAAFDHRHIFLDPEPDAALSFAERRRLFELPRSSWADYDPTLISPGGGVFPRSAKSIEISPQVRERLGIAADVEALPPNALMSAILTAPVDLLWNGGIGTYVKAATETSLDVGDKANDALRVNGGDLRCRVVGEGGNLGLTQLGRIEAALAGVRLNTDAIDNSAGVDTSDHEVNIKILVDSAIRDGAMPRDERDVLLESMTNDVARLVLEDNYEQNLLLATDRTQASVMLGVHQRLIRELEASGELDRALENLPTDAEIDRRAALGLGLTSPELSVLCAHVKIALTASLMPAQMAAEPWFGRELRTYFPGALVERLGDRLDTHPLANEIVTTAISNDMVNHGGITYAFRVMEETGATPIELARAYLVATRVFDLPELWRRIESLDDVAPTQAQTALLLEVRRLLDRASRWTLQTRGRSVDVDAEVALLREQVKRIAPEVSGMLRGAEAARLSQHAERLVEIGAPEGLARDVAVLLDLFSLLDVIEVARRVGEDPAKVSDLYFAVSERFGGDLLLHRITGLPRPDRWSTMARAALRSDLYTALSALTSRISRATPSGLSSEERIDRWEAGQPEGVTRARGTLQEIIEMDSADIATISVALRALRALVAQGGTQSPVSEA